jgi:hypothetical protein
MMEEKSEKPIITCNYGTDGGKKRFDIQDILGNKLLEHRLTKIKCFLKPNKSIYGIQFIYRNINDCAETAFIDFKTQDNDLIEQEMDLNNEDIVDLRVWVDQEVKLIGFEVKTSKNRIQKFGYGDDTQLIKISDFENLDQIIVGFGCCADDTDGITSIYAYYISKKKYISIIYSRIFALRIKNKDPQYKEKVENKLKKMDEKYKILYRICKLPDNQFFSIIKYSID